MKEQQLSKEVFSSLLISFFAPAFGIQTLQPPQVFESSFKLHFSRLDYLSLVSHC